MTISNCFQNRAKTVSVVIQYMCLEGNSIYQVAPTLAASNPIHSISHMFLSIVIYLTSKVHCLSPPFGKMIVRHLFVQSAQLKRCRYHRL